MKQQLVTIGYEVSQILLLPVCVSRGTTWQSVQSFARLSFFERVSAEKRFQGILAMKLSYKSAR